MEYVEEAVVDDGKRDIEKVVELNGPYFVDISGRLERQWTIE